jgi:signal transduction histidine kinase
MAALHEFMREHRAAILERCARKIARGDDLPEYFDELVTALTRGTNGAPRRRFREGFDLSLVVHEYGAMCESITEEAMACNQPIEVREFWLLNQALDLGIAGAVERFTAERELAHDSSRASHLGFIAHELRNALSIAIMSFDLIRKGKVPVQGRTAEILWRSQLNLRDLVGRLLTDVRLRSGVLEREHLRLAPLLEEVEAAASLHAETRDIALNLKVDSRLEVDGDRQLLRSAVSNLVQNAIKFTPAGGHVELRGYGNDNHVMVDVEDECGGLPEGKVEELFSPFVQKGNDRSGLGLGLAIARDAVQLHRGELRARSLDGKGCLFTIVLPKS